jgi:hypothetical protein
VQRCAAVSSRLCSSDRTGGSGAAPDAAGRLRLVAAAAPADLGRGLVGDIRPPFRFCSHSSRGDARATDIGDQGSPATAGQHRCEGRNF